METVTVEPMNSEETTEEQQHKLKFNEKLKSMIEDGKVRKSFSKVEYLEMLKKIQSAESDTDKKANNTYYLVAMYDVMLLAGASRLVKKNACLYYAYSEEIFDLLMPCHKLVGHGGQKKTLLEICKFINFTSTLTLP